MEIDYEKAYKEALERAKRLRDSKYQTEQKEQKPPIAGNDFGWIDELKHDLEHPEELDQKVDDVLKQRKGIRALEWSEEDREMIQSIITNGCVDDKQERWLRMLPERICQPKQEWSEEDEKMLDEVLDKVTYAFYNQGLDGEIEDDPAFLWLHRLRPSWKPSEEQIGALYYAYCELFKRKDVGHNILGPLQKLCDELKKM